VVVLIQFERIAGECLELRKFGAGRGGESQSDSLKRGGGGVFDRISAGNGRFEDFGRENLFFVMAGLIAGVETAKSGYVCSNAETFR